MKTYNYEFDSRSFPYRDEHYCWVLRHHDWDGCKCKRCGKEKHDWDGCKCKRCGKRQNKDHVWNGCKCNRCGKTRNEQHDWNNCMCNRCGKPRKDVEHDWEFVRETIHTFDESESDGFVCIIQHCRKCEAELQKTYYCYPEAGIFFGDDLRKKRFRRRAKQSSKSKYDGAINSRIKVIRSFFARIISWIFFPFIIIYACYMASKNSKNNK